MIERKNMGRVSTILLALLSFGFFFATYNLLTMIIHNKASNLGSWESDGLDSSGDLKPKYHVALTATDAPYSQWQCRIMYYWYKKTKDVPGSDMGKCNGACLCSTCQWHWSFITVVVDSLVVVYGEISNWEDSSSFFLQICY